MGPVSLLVATLLMLSGAPFWESKPPARWSDQELELLLTDSPWAQVARAGSGAPSVQTFLASARPIQEAENERIRRAGRLAPEEAFAEDYLDSLSQNRGKRIILAVHLPGWDPAANPRETRRLEAECIPRAGKRKLRMIGYFPPSATDPYLRLVFPRDITLEDRSLLFELYLPGVPQPLRQVEFRIKDLVYRNAPDF